MEQKSRIHTWESVNFNSLASSSAVPLISHVHLPECNTREPISFVRFVLCKMSPFWRKYSIRTALWVWYWWAISASCETSWIGIGLLGTSRVVAGLETKGRWMEGNRKAVLANWTTALEVCTVENVSLRLTFLCASTEGTWLVHDLQH